MATKDVLGTVYETLLCSPGMNEVVKVDAKISRKAILLLNGVIETGLGGDNMQAQELLRMVPETDTEELKIFAGECLKKAGLTELSEKIKSLTSK